MAVISCDICGCSLEMDVSGNFAVCGSCGMKHTKERLMAMAQKSVGTVKVSNISSVEAFMKRGHLALEDSNWQQAMEYFDRVLDINPEYALADVGMLCAESEHTNEISLIKNLKPLSEYGNYQKAVRFADNNLKARLEKYDSTIKNRILEKRRKEEEQSNIAKRKLAPIRERIAKYQCCIGVTSSYTVGLKTDGTVIVAGDESRLPFSCYNFENIVAISATTRHLVGLRLDGTVIADGLRDKYNDHKNEYLKTDHWHDIVAISASSKGLYYGTTVGLKSDGTVITTGQIGRCNDEPENWRDIVAIYAADGIEGHIFGLKSNGTVVTTCYGDVKDWRDIVAICANDFDIVGLKSDGTIVATSIRNKETIPTKSYQDIVAISGFFGLKSDGTVIHLQDKYSKAIDTKGFHDIVAISGNITNLVGLNSNGTVVSLGAKNNECADWRDIGPLDPKQYQRRLEIENARKLEIERAELSKRWKMQGLCQYCGGLIVGVFSKKCKRCGEPA